MSKPWKYIESDLIRYAGKATMRAYLKNYFFNPAFKYMFWFRLLKSKNVFLKSYAKLMHKILSVRYQIQIPKEVDIGYGLYIGHGTGLIINATAKIGSNVNLSPFTVIGSNKGKAAHIENNVYVGPHVCIIENVVIGDGAIIGAGTVVLNDVPAKAVMVGNPGRIIKENTENEFIVNPFVGEI